MNIITKEFYKYNDRYYIDIDNHKIKVPYRYNRVMCTVNGLTPVQSLKLNDTVIYETKEVMWEGTKYKVLKSIEYICSQGRGS